MRVLSVIAPLLGLSLLAMACGTGDNLDRERPFSGEPTPTGDPSGSEACLDLDLAHCQESFSCEALPYWGISPVPCESDERGFSDHCPYEGCRPAGADCADLEDLHNLCSEICAFNDFGIDRDTGCRTCSCRHRYNTSLPHSMKGYELYSWPAEPDAWSFMGEWNFTLVTGTNRTKSCQEVTTTGDTVTAEDWVKITVRGVPALLDVLARLPAGEHLVWWTLVDPPQDACGVVIPCPDVVEKVQDVCLDLGVDLYVSGL